MAPTMDDVSRIQNVFTYSRWSYGQILAIAPLQPMYGKEYEKEHLAPSCIARGRGDVSTLYFHHI